MKNSPTSEKKDTSVQASLNLMSRYVAALQKRDIDEMNALRSADFIRDLVAGDAFLNNPIPNQDVSKFWRAWFAGFEDMDYEVVRTIASESVVVLEWTFTGTNSGLIDLEIFNRLVEPTGKTVCFRGASIYEIDHGLIKKETLYMDLATLWVELGVLT